MKRISMGELNEKDLFLEDDIDVELASSEDDIDEEDSEEEEEEKASEEEY